MPEAIPPGPCALPVIQHYLALRDRISALPPREARLLEPDAAKALEAVLDRPALCLEAVMAKLTLALEILTEEDPDGIPATLIRSVVQEGTMPSALAIDHMFIGETHQNAATAAE